MMQTRCPACGTRFLITPEQLKARQGQVRCGQCQTIFDALATLSDTPPSTVSQPSSPAPASVAPLTTPAATSQASVCPPESSDAARATAETTETAAAATPVTAQDEAADRDPAPHIDADATVDPSTDQPDSPAPPAEQGTISGGAKPETQPAIPSEAEVDTHIMPASLPGSSWHQGVISSSQTQTRKQHSRLWLLLSLLAAVVFAGQVVVQFRSGLTLAFPAIKPLLQAALGTFDIDLPLPHQAEQLSIENSDLQPLANHPGELELTATLKNRAAFAQLPPHLELTLTNAFDQPVLRKILAPSAYLPNQPRQQQSFGPGEEVSLHLILQPAKDLKSPASGYRLYLFYP